MEQKQFNKDPELWELAKKRAGFKGHLLTYAAMIPFFWVVWFLTGEHLTESGVPWPVWPMFGWGIGLFFHFLGVYVFHKYNLIEKEYEKLTRNRER
jgi:sterol desaturase/sphingolipid hydroxylase (fatty acid hydroxylase superfamily)